MKQEMKSMSLISRPFSNTDSHDFDLLHWIYDLQAANVARSKTSFALVFVAIHAFNELLEQYGEDSANQACQQISEYLNNQIRNTDKIFQLSQKNKWAILMLHSGQEEAKYFLKRIFQSIPYIDFEQGMGMQMGLSASIVEIANSTTSYAEALSAGEEALQLANVKGDKEIYIVEMFNKPELEKIKVSIIEDDEVMKSILLTMLQRIAIDYFELSIQTFNDGNQFLQSSWSQSGHTHIVIMNDILPKKNGIAVLHELRRMPNSKKYIVFMFSKLKTEEDMIYAFEAGVDEYIIKPYNVKLVAARLKRMLARLR
ncbi:response regulator [Domibacillus mangrovi]|uniref:Response regulatory domain-containing protein n=1 Tax=Domibacillus mangrovi TaxID=1714354 RepID=A0A1Q5P6G1_9BACI|nr:response regulator [Domibacillus mangrovi]OKL37860.1 hypothetical protein BLL40_00025 [Domibacillus mangrovi]